MRRARTPDIDYDRLCQSVKNARLVLQPFRETRRDIIRQFAGSNWGKDNAKKKTPLNLIALYTEVVTRALVSHTPRVLIRTADRGLKKMVGVMQDWANKHFERIGLAATLSTAVDDAMTYLGIVKVALATPAEAQLSGWTVKAGAPYAEPVSLDDFVYDVHAKTFRDAIFLGHRMRVPLAAVKEGKFYRHTEEVEATADRRHNEAGDERPKVLQRNYLVGDDEDAEDMTDIWEVWLPWHRTVCTFRADDAGNPVPSASGECLREVEWVGPARGPYHFLALDTVPDNAMPKGPLLDLWDLHESVNKLLRKLILQGERQKEVLPVKGTAAEDGARLLTTSDGEAFKCENADTLKPITFGGPNANNFQLMNGLKELFSWRAGNLDIMGGLSPQAKTLGQDKMLNANSSRQVTDMQDTTVSFVSDVMDSLCWYHHYHPTQTMTRSYSPQGAPHVTRELRSTPEERRAVRYEDLDVRVDPYSLTHTTPQAQADQLNQIVMQIVLPLMPLLEKQGIGFDANAFFSKQAAYLNMPDLPEIITVQEPPQDAAGGAAETAPGPANTSREYVRRSAGGGQPPPTNMDLAQKLMGAGAQGTAQFAAPTAG